MHFARWMERFYLPVKACCDIICGMLIACVAMSASLSVFDYATNCIVERVERSDPAECLSRFSEYPPSKGRLGFPRCLFQDPFPENEKFWLNDVDFSCASPWNDAYETLRAGTLISRRHVVFAAHYPLDKGGRILFVDKEFDVCERYIGKSKTVPGTDIQIAALTEEVSSNIRPAKILPENYADYIGDGAGLPVVTFNQHEEALLTEMNPIPTNRVAASHGSRQPRGEGWSRFRKPLISGDSGNPAFLLVGDQPILLCCLHTGGCGAGPSLLYYRREIQKAMDELCPGYELESFDFSRVTSDMRK